MQTHPVRAAVPAAGMLLLMLLAASPLSALEKIGRARITYYWLVDETDPAYAQSTRVAIRDVRGKVIARTSWKFRRHLLREGCGRLRDGRVVTYQKHVKGEARFRVTRHEYGAGIGSCGLEPYRTIAVDPKFIPLGTRVFIPEVKGMKLPDGTLHDGIFVANDRSKYVRGAHIDLFTKSGKKSAKVFAAKGLRSGSRVTLYRIGRPERGGCHTE